MLPLLLLPYALAAPVDPFDEPDESELFRLDEELVTVASRYAQTVRQAPSIVSVVTADDIRERGYRTLADAMRDLPGVYVWKSPEGRDLVAFRGIVAPDNNKVLLLVDGVPWYDGVYAHAFIGDYLPISHVKQIEVIKGPGSAIYGTGAFAGVINVVTWAPADLDGGRVRWMIGSNGRSDVTGTVGASQRVGTLDTAMIGYARFFTQDGLGLDVQPNRDRNVQGEDPKRGIAVGARLEVENLRVQIHHVDYRHTYLTQQSADSPFDLVATDIDTNGIFYHDTFFDLRYHAPVGKKLTITPHLWSQRHDDPGSYWFLTGVTSEDPDGDGVFDGSIDSVLVETEKDTRRWGTGLDLEARPGVDHHTVAGLGIEHTTVLGLLDRRYDAENPDGEWTGFGLDIPADGPYPQLCNAYGFAQHSWIAIPGVEVVGGARADKRYACSAGYEPEGKGRNVKVSPRAAVLLVPTEAVTAKLLYGQAFRYGTVREVLVQSPIAGDRYAFTDGNAALEPESIQTAEAEVTGRLSGGVELRGDVSYSIVTDEINKLQIEEDADGTVVTGSRYLNTAGQLRVLGAEAEARATIGVADVRLAYGFVDARYGGDSPFAGRVQYEFPPHMVKGDVRVTATDRLVGVLIAEGYSGRPRRDWSPDAGIRDGDLFGLLHLGVSMDRIGPQERSNLVVSVRNVSNTAWETGVYRDEANELDDGDAQYPLGIAGEGRTVHVGLETRF